MIKRLLIALVVVILVVIGLVFTHQFNVDMIVNIFTVIAVIIPIYYFFKILSSQKITATERSRVFAYIPLFIAGVLFWSIEEQGSVVLALFADDQTRLYFNVFGNQIHFPSSFFQSY